MDVEYFIMANTKLFLRFPSRGPSTSSWEVRRRGRDRWSSSRHIPRTPRTIHFMTTCFFGTLCGVLKIIFSSLLIVNFSRTPFLYEKWRFIFDVIKFTKFLGWLYPPFKIISEVKMRCAIEIAFRKLPRREEKMILGWLS